MPFNSTYTQYRKAWKVSLFVEFIFSIIVYQHLFYTLLGFSDLPAFYCCDDRHVFVCDVYGW